MKHRGILCALFAGLASWHAAGAQRGKVSVRGVVFDSLRRQPIRNAFVSIAGSSQVIATDARGRFEFDSVSPGIHRVTAQHPLLDSIGLSGLSALAAIGDSSGEVHLAVPSFATLWAVACGNGHVPADSGIVYGTIRSAAEGRPVANAAVELSWSDLRVDKRHRLVERRWQIETRSNALGGYAACGVAADLGLRLHARADSNESGAIDLPPLATRVERRDLLVGSIAGADSSRRGAIAGLVQDRFGQPLGNARVVMDRLPPVHTGADGRFTLPNVPSGTRQVEVLAIGAAPVLAAVDVTPGKATTITVKLEKVLTLDAIRTIERNNRRVAAAEFNARRKLGFGYARDSTEIVKYDQFVNVLRDVPSLNVQYRGANLSLSFPDGAGHSCPPDIYIDGAKAGFGNLIDLFPHEVGAFEAYPRAAHVPARFVPPGIQPQCGMILVWTKYGLSNR